MISGDRKEARLVYLRGSREIIGQRLAARKGHFMPPSLLDSQFAALEEPGADEAAIRVDAAATPQAIVDRVVDALGEQPRSPG